MGGALNCVDVVVVVHEVAVAVAAAAIAAASSPGDKFHQQFQWKLFEKARLFYILEGKIVYLFGTVIIKCVCNSDLPTSRCCFVSKSFFFCSDSSSDEKFQRRGRDGDGGGGDGDRPFRLPAVSRERPFDDGDNYRIAPNCFPAKMFWLPNMIWRWLLQNKFYRLPELKSRKN